MGWDISLEDKDGNPGQVTSFFWGSNILVGVIGDKVPGGIDVKGEFWLRNGASFKELQKTWGVSMAIAEMGTTLPISINGQEIWLTGQTESRISITYNYKEIFDFDSLNRKTGQETLPLLKEWSEKEDTEEQDYWTCSPGNVAKICHILVSWAEVYPDYTWRVS